MNQLKSYFVQGWMADPEARNDPKRRKPMKVTRIEAIDAKAAAATYARINNIRKSWWDDGSATPLVVIRVEGHKNV